MIRAALVRSLREPSPASLAHERGEIMTSGIFIRKIVVAIAAFTIGSAAHAAPIMISTPAPLATAVLPGADPIFNFTDIGVGVVSSGTLNATANGRSEERRVGKECRSRW